MLSKCLSYLYAYMLICLYKYAEMSVISQMWFTVFCSLGQFVS